MFCTQCGHKIMEDGKFCANCGEALPAQAQVDRIASQPVNKIRVTNQKIDRILRDGEQVLEHSRSCRLERKQSWLEIQFAYGLTRFLNVDLYFTNQGRLIHVPKEFNYVRGETVQIDAKEIADIRGGWVKAIWIPLLPVLMIVTLKDGSRYAYVLYNKKKWISGIMSAIGRATP